jgi:hypothetical protein
MSPSASFSADVRRKRRPAWPQISSNAPSWCHETLRRKMVDRRVDLELGRVLGRGVSGRVLRVRDRRTAAT